MKKLGILLIVMSVVLFMLFSVRVFAGSVMLAWDSPTDRTDGSAVTNLAGYKLYWGLYPGEYTGSVTVNFCHACPSPSSPVMEWECLPLQPNTTYYFVATAFDEAGNESGYSNEVSYTTGAATNPSGNCALSPTSTKCRVDGYDLIFVNKQFGKTIMGSACTQTNYQTWKTIERADLNYDGIIDGLDKGIVSANFGKSYSPCP